MSEDSYLKSYTHDGGTAQTSAGLKAKERGLLERMDALLASNSPDPAKSFIDRIVAQSTPLRADNIPASVLAAVYDVTSHHGGAHDCSTCAHGETDLTPNDNALVEIDQRINGLWPTKEAHTCQGH